MKKGHKWIAVHGPGLASGVGLGVQGIFIAAELE